MVRIENFPTPRRGITHASTLTERSIRDLPTILVYCKKTADHLVDIGYQPPADKALHSVLVPSVNYIEWMMGYPLDWTRLDRSDASIPMPPARAAVARARAAAAYADADADADEAGADADADAYEDDNDDEDHDEEDDDNNQRRMATVLVVKKIPTPTTTTTRRGRIAKPPAGGARPASRRLHGMHVFMKEHPGKDVPKVAKLWRELLDEEKATYSDRAKEILRGEAEAAQKISGHQHLHPQPLPDDAASEPVGVQGG